MAYNMPKISPSALQAVEKCPRFRSSGESNAVADEGTNIHELLEQMVSQPKSSWAEWIRTQDVSAEHRELMEKAAEAVAELVTEGMSVFTDRFLKFKKDGSARKTRLPAGLYPELVVETGKGRVGKIDLLIVTEDNLAIVIDWKSDRVYHDHELQLAAYTLALSRLVPAFKTFDCRIVAPRLVGEPETHLWSVDDLASIAKRIADIERRADDALIDSSIKSCPDEFCQYCHWNGRCPAQSENAVAAIPLDADPPVPKPTVKCLMNPETPEERGYRRAFIKPLEAAIKAWKKQDEEFFTAHQDNPNIVPGFKATWARKPSFLDESSEAQPRIRLALMSELGLSDLELADCSPVDKKMVIELLTRTPERGGRGMKEKEAKQAVEKALDPFMRRNEGKSLRVVSTESRTKEQATPSLDVF